MKLLQAFTWQQFLVAALVLSLVWYGYVWRRYYRRGIREDEPLPHRWSEDVFDAADADVLGKPAEEAGVSVVSTDDYGFAALPSQALSKEDQLGLVPDVKEDVRSICRMIAEEDGTKEEFFSMFGLIRNKYPIPSLQGVLPELNAFIREQVPFLLQPDELDRLWT